MSQAGNAARCTLHSALGGTNTLSQKAPPLTRTGFWGAPAVVHHNWVAGGKRITRACLALAHWPLKADSQG